MVVRESCCDRLYGNSGAWNARFLGRRCFGGIFLLLGIARAGIIGYIFRLPIRMLTGIGIIISLNKYLSFLS